MSNEKQKVSRHGFMQMSGAASVLGLSRSLFPSWMPRLAFSDKRTGAASKTSSDVLVVIFQRGGMDGLNVVVPFGEGRQYYDKRPTIAIPEPGKHSDSVIDLDGFFGLHPSLKPLKEVYDNQHLKVIHAAGSPDPSRSHFDAMETMERGTPGEKMLGTGWLNRHLQTTAWQNESPLRAVGMGVMMQGALRGPVSTLALKSITDYHMANRGEDVNAILKTLASLYSAESPQDALGMQSSSVFKTIDLLSKLAATEYKPAESANYPVSDYGTGLKQIAQLIKADVGLEVACVDIGGWDTHEEQGGAQGQLASMLGDFGQGLAAFYHDLGNLIQNVTVVTMSEFGRRATENSSKGTDHGHGNCMFVMGGAVNGGTYAKWPGLADDKLDAGDLAITTDYRDVLSEILAVRVGNPSITDIFPGYKPNHHGLVKAR